MLFLQGNVIDCLKTLPDQSIHCCITSPPYWNLRNYSTNPQIWGGNPSCEHEWINFFCPKCGAWLGELGHEPTPELYVEHLVMVFREVKRVLRDDGSLWLNLGDGYSNKQLQGIPWMTAFALRDDGWYLRSAIVWHKPNPMPSSVTDRPTSSYEFIFLLAKSERYFYDHIAVQEDCATPDDGHPKLFGGTKYPDEDVNRTYSGNPYEFTGKRNKRDVWTVSTKPFKGAHFATFPEDLIEPCINAATSEKGCCPKCGSPFVRKTEKRVADVTNPRPFSKPGNVDRNDVGNIYEETVVHTIGWQPTCSCGLDPIPCTTLDPFGGSGTVAKVSRDLGRNSIYIDLNPQYVDMAMKRVGSSLFNSLERKVV